MPAVVLGDSVLVDASGEIEHRFFWSYTTPDPDDPFTVVIDAIYQSRERAGEVWESRVADEPYRGKIAPTPSGLVFEHYENSASYDQGRIIYVHQDVFKAADFSAWSPAPE